MFEAGMFWLGKGCKQQDEDVKVPLTEILQGEVGITNFEVFDGVMWNVLEQIVRQLRLFQPTHFHNRSKVGELIGSFFQWRGYLFCYGVHNQKYLTAVVLYQEKSPQYFWKCQVRASYLQIYNEVISDLLKPDRSHLMIRSSDDLWVLDFWGWRSGFSGLVHTSHTR